MILLEIRRNIQQNLLSNYPTLARRGDESLLKPYKGEMEFDQLPDTLEKLFPEENQKYSPKKVGIRFMLDKFLPPTDNLYKL